MQELIVTSLLFVAALIGVGYMLYLVLFDPVDEEDDYFGD